MNIDQQSSPNPDFIRQLVEAIADHNDHDPDAPGFCLYEKTDPEALESYLANTDGPVTVEFPVDEGLVTITKTIEKEISIDVEARATPPVALDD